MIHVVARVQKDKDDSWGQKDWPHLNVSPPAATRLKAGVSPAAIADPALRAEYEAALDENRQKGIRAREQRQIRNLERSFLPWAQERLADLYADGDDVSEVVSLCDEWGVDPAWRDGVVESLQEPTKK